MFNERDITCTKKHIHVLVVEVGFILVVGELRGSSVGDGVLANGRNITCTKNHIYTYLL